jgi:hypothetical protein
VNFENLEQIYMVIELYFINLGFMVYNYVMWICVG